MSDNVYFAIIQFSDLIQIGIWVFLFNHIMKNRIPFFAIWGIIYSVQFLMTSFRLFFDMPLEINSIINFIILFLGIVAFYKEAIWKKIVCFIGTFFISSLISIAASVFVEELIEVHISILTFESEWNALGKLLCSDILMAAILFGCWVILIKRKNKGNTMFLKSQLGIFILIVIVHFIVLVLRYDGEVNPDAVNLLMDYILQTIVIFLLYLQYFMACRNIELIEKNYIYSLEQSKQENELKYYELAQAKFDDISKIRHDLNNHIGLMKQFVMNDQKNEAQEVIEDICRRLDEIKAVQYCNDPLINTILTTKANEPAYKNIDMQFVMKDCDLIPCNTAELCSLISNLFDNAARAALESGSKPILQMESGSVNEFFVIKTINTSKENAVTTDIHTISTKNESGHGYGLSIISMIAKKYEGSFFLEQSGGFVTATVIMKHHYGI